MIRELVINEAITFEKPPDGGQLAVIDPYDGCTIRCPYCFQMNDKDWNKETLVKINIADLIKTQLKDWNKDQTVYIGSKCDPYMDLEEKYELTRKCLIELNELKIPTMITTKAHHNIIFRDINLLKDYKADLTVLLGLSNLNLLTNIENSHMIKNIQVANKLHEQGIKVWAFITPILPGITDVNKMIGSLNKDIPVYLDKLRIEKDSIPKIKMMEFINKRHPELNSMYEEIINNDNNNYIEELRNQWKDSTRVKFVFD
jgi:DNA repair photolyase